ncbi:MAG: hypothetical protein N2578_06560 [Bdellovibrionaceae bacterium]|nr:hypothetical protein [Pseudobdellovibrionaceae bacterium]
MKRSVFEFSISAPSVCCTYDMGYTQFPSRQEIRATLGLEGAEFTQALIKQPAQAADGYLEMALDEKLSYELRYKAVSAFSQLKGYAAITDLKRLVSNENWFIRISALNAIERLDEAAFREIALRLLQDRALVVRSAAVDKLKEKMSPEIRQSLWQAMEDKINFHKGYSLWIRAQILEALAQNPLKEESAIFQRFLSDKDEAVRQAARRALLNL